MSQNKRMGDYARFSGDYDGVVNTSEGYVAKCDANNRWWLAPACRSDPTTCIPVFTAGSGWKLQAMMQWSTAYGMPTAITVSSSWSNFVNHGKSFLSYLVFMAIVLSILAARNS